MSIFAKKISKEELDAIYKQVQSISDYLMKLTDLYFGSLFENESKEDETFRLFIAETTVLYAMYENWIKSKDPTRTVIGRTADIKQLLADSHNYPFNFACEVFDAVKDRVRGEQRNYSAEEVEMAYACAFFDFTIGRAMKDNGISAEDVGDDLIAKVCFLFADAFIKGMKGIVDISKSLMGFNTLADKGQAILSKAQILNLTLNLMLAKGNLDRETYSKICDLYVELQTNESYIEEEVMDVFEYSSAFFQVTLDFSYYVTSIDPFINRDFSPASLEKNEVPNMMM